ncbi:Cytoskeleton organization protein (Dec1) [Penicillium verhagenii]|nr:Cytoskeleton organization protein (Dec1) [Penicillium verhagenii]
MADEAHKQRGIAETIELCKAEPPTTDIDTLEILNQTLQKMGGHLDTQSMLWEKAAKAKPNALDLQLMWFTYSFEEDDWKSAQKASMSLQKNFPRERKYYFWAIFCTHMLAEDKKSSEMERKLFGTLAYRMISKAAADVPTDPAQLLSQPRAIQKSEEMVLLVRILESQQRFHEIVKILDSNNVGINSRICQNDRTFLGSKATSLGSAKLWDDAITFVKEIFTVSDEEKRNSLRELDDWIIWNLLIEAEKNTHTPGTSTEILKIIENFTKFQPKSRNAALARLDIIASGIAKGEMSVEEHYLPACQKYIDLHKGKLYAFSDLKRVLAGKKDAMAKMLKYMSETESKTDDKYVINAKINALKLEYCLNISGAEASPSREVIEEFVTRCLNLYQTSASGSEVEKAEAAPNGSSSTIESKSTDDLCILAAMAIMSGTNEQSLVSHTSLLRASAILERLLRDSPHCYQALLLLVRMYLLFGAGSLAFNTFNKMSVKQVQYESVAHNFFTRLSTIHPHSAPPTEGVERKNFDPQAAFVQGLNFFRNADNTTMDFRSRGLDQGSYKNVEEIIELRRRLSQSICRRMMALDVRQAQRLVGGDPMTRFETLAQNDTPVHDQRVYDAFMDCEFPGKRSFEETVRPGPIPKANWLASARVTDRLFSVLKGISVQTPLTPETDLPDLSGLFISDINDQTEAEKEKSRIHSKLLMLATFMAGSKLTNPEQAEKALGEVEDWLNSKKINLTLNESQVSPLMISKSVYLQADCPTAATWEYLHSIFTLLETLKALSQLTTLASRKGSKSAKLPKERVERLSELVPQVFELVRSNTKSLKQYISRSGVLSTMVDVVIQGPPSSPQSKELQAALETTLGMSDLELFCALALALRLHTESRAKTRNCAVPRTLGDFHKTFFIPFFDNHRQPLQSPTVEMAQERTGIIVGTNSGRKTTALNTPKTKISRTKGQSSRRTQFVREIAREVVGLAPYERRVIELLRNAQDKRARKLAKKRLGTFTRGKRKVEDMQKVIAESRRVQGH